MAPLQSSRAFHEHRSHILHRPALFGLNRAGKILYTTLFVLAVPALVAWNVWLPRLRFSDQDERLFKAARHGNSPGWRRRWLAAPT